MLNYLRPALYGISTTNTVLLGMSVFQYVFSTPSSKYVNLAMRTGNNTPDKENLISTIRNDLYPNFIAWKTEYDARVTNFDLQDFMGSAEYLQEAKTHFVNNVFNEIFNERHSNPEFNKLSLIEQAEQESKIQETIVAMFEDRSTENLNILAPFASKFGKAPFNGAQYEYHEFSLNKYNAAFNYSLSQALNGYIVKNYNKDVRHNNQEHSLISGGTLLLGLASAFVPNINDTVKIGVQCACFVAAIFATKHMDKVNSDLSTTHGIVR